MGGDARGLSTLGGAKVDKQHEHKLGDLLSSEQLIRELYVDLRKRVNAWATLTHQTAQARMGYVGQHLVSIVTGYRGSRSGGRGNDLIIPDAEFAEIKTCYRVDQLGSCRNPACGAVVASIELQCHACGSTEITRKNDSKWLISFRNDEEYGKALDPKWYFPVLFELDPESPDTGTVRISIWRVLPTRPGFAYAMIDYFQIHRAKAVSVGKTPAPFDWWPHSLKFELMRPSLIYRSRILGDDVVTERFPGRDQPIEDQPVDWTEFAGSRNLTPAKLQVAANKLGVTVVGGNKREMTASLARATHDAGISQGDVADALAHALYRPEIDRYFMTLPMRLKEKMEDAGLLS